MSDASGGSGGTYVPTGIASWFPYGKNDSPGWRLDVVTLLAVIGESSIAEHSQAITASVLCLLPRILPAPQALLKPSRPGRMPEVAAKMAGVYSGVVLDSVSFFADIIHPLDELQPFSFHVYEIKHKHLVLASGSRPRTDSGHHSRWILHRLFNRNRVKGAEKRIPGPPEPATESNTKEGVSNGDSPGRTTGGDTGIAFAVDPERGIHAPQTGVTRRLTMQEKVTDFVANPTLTPGAKEQRPTVPPKLYSPVHVLSLFSFLLTIGLVAAAAYWQDGTAIVAIAMVSLAASVVGYASWWRPLLMNLSNHNDLPDGDVVIRTREGAFLLIKCTEAVARELYSGTEECEYRVGDLYYRGLMGLGTVLLMVSVVLLGNCSWNAQVFIGASYIVLNGLYWGMGLLPRKYFWDLGRYTWKEITPQDAAEADRTTDEKSREATKSYTRTLWYAIRETRRTGWVERSGAAPGTPQWRQWLAEAEHEAAKGNRRWAAVARKDFLMSPNAAVGNTRGAVMPAKIDTAEQRAPLSEVQPRRDSTVASPGSF